MMFQLHCKLGDCQILSRNFVVIKRNKYQVQWRKPSQLLGGLLNQDINVINSIIFEDDKKKKTLLITVLGHFRIIPDVEESTSGNETSIMST